ncbi:MULTISPECIES: ABC transporter ATP-binding protein [unclassified Helicobacter]|uniref:ABC transporter ATP-binding protein n=1 Tax=unclassified Helicobacter TaxID=2593540 RepID=UPI000CF0804C|nr:MULTISPECIES: ABC transporter ATP-binding protein [unclassified Helicobacter]
MHCFKVNNLYVSRDKKKILQGVNLEIFSSQLTAILAPNGSGKTTLMEAIIGGIRLDDGSIFYDEIDVLKLSCLQRSKIIAFIPQNFECVFDYSVLDFVLLGGNNELKWYGNPDKKLLEQAELLLKDLGILSLKNQSLNALSGGQKQMVLLARALLQKSKVLFLDEPTAWLDLKNQSLFFEILKEKIKENNLCALINIHDPNLVCKYAERVFMLRNGKNFCDGSIKETMTQENLTQLYGLPVWVEQLSSQVIVLT